MNTQQNNQQKEKPSYYAVIPAEIRYADIPLGSRMLFGELTALSNKEGYCWATNSYFAELYNVEIRTIQNWLKALQDAGFIFMAWHYLTQKVGSNMRTERQIYIAKFHGMKIFSGGDEKNFIHNNTSNNISNRNITNDVPSVPKVQEDKRNPQVQAVLDAFKKTFGHDPIDPKPRFIAKAFVTNLNKLASVKKDFDFNQTLLNVFRKYKAEFPDMSTRSLNTVRRHAKVYIEKTITYSQSNP